MVLSRVKKCPISSDFYLMRHRIRLVDRLGGSRLMAVWFPHACAGSAAQESFVAA